MTLPAPPIAPDVDIRDFAFTPIFRARLFGSSFHARASDAEWRAGVTLWLKSWDQVPAGSLPDDDIDLCRLAELGRDLKTWKKIKSGALHGWRKCSDDRLYHNVVAEGVNEAWQSKLEQRWRSECGRIKKHNQRHGDTVPIPTLEKYLSSRHGQAVPRDKPDLSPGTYDDCPEIVPEETPSKGQRQGQYEDIKGARDPNPPPRPVDVIAAFDSILHEVFGADQCRLNPNASDHVYAQRFLESGAGLDLIVGTIRPIVQRFKAEGQRAPSNLKMFEPWITGAVQALNAPPAEARHVNGTRSSGKPARRTTEDALREIRSLRTGDAGALEPFSDPAGGPVIDQVAGCH